MALDEPRYCELCRMWLNGDAQYYRHLQSKKHKRSLRCKRVQDWFKDNEGHIAQPQVDTAVAAQNNQTRPQNNQTRRARSCGAVREKGPLEPR